MDSSAIFAVTAIASAIGGLALWAVQRSSKSKEPTFPSLPKWPLLGNILDYADASFTKRINSYPTPVWFSLPGFMGPILLVHDPDQARYVSSKAVSSRIVFGEPKLTTLFGGYESIFGATGKEHKRLRVLSMKAVSKNAMKQQFPLLQDLARETLENMARNPKAETQGISCLPHFQKLAFNAICIFMAGGDEAQLNQLVGLYDDFIDISHGFKAMFLPPFLEYFNGGLKAKAFEAQARILTKVSEITNERRCAMEDGNIYSDALSSLIEARDENGSSLSDRDIGFMFLVLCGAGFETTSMQLTTIFYFITNMVSNTDLEALQQEVDSFGELSESNLSQSPILNAFVKESLRIFNVAPFVIRIATEDFTLDGVNVPANSLFAAFHERGSLIEGGEAFELKRYLGDPSFDKDEFMPFGTGERRCLGFQLAMLEIKIVIAELLRGFVATKGVGKAKHVHVGTRLIESPVCIRPK
ncbi:cytochrome P450 [Rhizoclosmatium globosum]|uniref:Cytochrome P450 n=1 Tax=Rhizoclosmatium globosum TaxID=329046 RepID=A0A1Y2CJB5_9FUNG|nr:cytochrome P450 [Rhizoclosmatium globosum]|eukprot:ORY46997.1 cytochrome P450 [Rhizoclosmatium globosum]